MASTLSNQFDRDSANSAPSFPEQTCDIQELMCSFLRQHTAYDVLPVSYRLIVFDTRLLVKKALDALVQNGNSSVLFLLLLIRV
jgi:hypothetical protein